MSYHYTHRSLEREKKYNATVRCDLLRQEKY